MASAAAKTLTRKLITAVHMVRLCDSRIEELRARKRSISRFQSNRSEIADGLDKEIGKVEVRMVGVEEKLLAILLERKVARERNAK